MPEVNKVNLVIDLFAELLEYLTTKQEFQDDQKLQEIAGRLQILRKHEQDLADGNG